LRPQNVAFVRVQGPYAAASRDAWEQVKAWVQKAGGGASPGPCYGLLLDDCEKVAPEKCRYDACFEVADGFGDRLPETFGYRRLPAGAFARQRHAGPLAGIPPVIASLREMWSNAESFNADTRRPVVEIYLDGLMPAAEDRMRIDLCLPVAALSRDEFAAA
jgi:AraC family transcriptional regulator